MLIEVKAISNFEQIPFRVGHRQVERLRYVRDRMQEDWGREVLLCFAFVGKKQEVVCLSLSEYLGE